MTVAMEVRVLLAHQVEVPNRGAAQLPIQRHAPHRGVENRNPDVKDPLGPARGAPDLDSHEPHAMVVLGPEWPGWRRDEVADEDADPAHEHILEPVHRIDLDHHPGRVRREKLVIDTEHEFVIPCGVVAATGVDAGGELPVWLDPRNSVGPHGAGHPGKVLGRDDVQLEELERVENYRRHYNRPKVGEL